MSTTLCTFPNPQCLGCGMWGSGELPGLEQLLGHVDWAEIQGLTEDNNAKVILNEPTRGCCSKCI